MSSRSRMMGAGNASATTYNTNVNLNTFGGNKKQGITSRVGLDNWANVAVQTYSNGYGRNKLFCMNQLGGVGAGKSMFNGRFTQTDGTHCPPDEGGGELPRFNPVTDEPYQLFFANRQHFTDPDENTIRNYGLYNDEFVPVRQDFSSNVSKPFTGPKFHNILVDSTTSWYIDNIAPNLTNFTNAYVELFLNTVPTTQTMPTFTVTYNGNTVQTYSKSTFYPTGSYVAFTGTLPSFLQNMYPLANQIQLSTVTGNVPSSIQSIKLGLNGNINNLVIVNIGHVGTNNNYLHPCEWAASNYTYNQTLDEKNYSVYPIRNVDLDQRLVTSYISGLKDNDASVTKIKETVTNGTGMRLYGIQDSDLTTSIDLSFYSQGTSTALDLTKNIPVFVIVEVLPFVPSLNKKGCPQIVIKSQSQTYVYSTTDDFPIVTGMPYKVLLWIGTNDPNVYPEITQRVRLTSTNGFPSNQSQVIQSASLRMGITTCKSMVLMTGGISFLNALGQSITSVTAFGAVQHSLVVPIQASTDSTPQKATVRLTNILNTSPYGNMYTQSIPLTSTRSEIVFPMMTVYNTINLTIDYEYVNDAGVNRSSLNNITLLGIQLVRDVVAGGLPAGSETLIVLRCAYNALNKNLEIIADLRNTNLNRMDGVFVYVDSVNTANLVGEITSTGESSFNITNLVGNWTSGPKTVYFIPYRDEHVITKYRTKNVYDVVNQILTRQITLV